MNVHIYHVLVLLLPLLFGQCALGQDQSTNSSSEDRLEKEIMSEYSKRWEYPTAEEDLVENLLLSSINNDAIPDPLACTELDPQKYFDVMNIEKKILTICDLCPHLPLQKLANVNFDQIPIMTKHNSSYHDCLAICLSSPSCMAFSFGEGKCSVFENTEGNLVKVNGWQLTIVTQPTGIIRDWVYSRNTAAKFGLNVNVSESGYFKNGAQVERSSQDSFTNCLQRCDVNSYCISVSYQISSKNCELLLNIDNPLPELAVDYKYGHLAALKINRFASARNNSWWRFQNPLGHNGELTEVFRELFAYETNKTTDVRNDFGEIPSIECSIRNVSFCASNETIRCRNPENSGDKEQYLPICPGSRHTKYREIKTLMDDLQNCFHTCLDDILCVGVTYNPEGLACDAITINDNSIFNASEIFFPLRIPSTMLNNTALRYSIYPGFAIDETGISNSLTPNASSCLDLCRNSLICQRFSYDGSSNQCKLADQLTPLVANPKGLLFVQVPEISSPKIRFSRLVSTELVGRYGLNYLKSSEKLSKEMMELYADGCLVECLDYFDNQCQFVRVEYDFKKGMTTCILYQNGAIFPFDGAATSVEVYVRNSYGNLGSFSQENLDKIPFFGSADFTSCFRPKSPLSFNNLQGLNSEVASFPVPVENITTRLAYPKTSYVRVIPTELTDSQRNLKDVLFDTLGYQLLDVADELVPMNKVNNSLNRKSSVVKIWQSINLESVFQEIRVLPYDRKHSPFRIIRDSSTPRDAAKLSSFGAGQSGLMLVLEKFSRNKTEFSSLAAQSIYGHSGHLNEFTRSIRFQFSSFERLQRNITDKFMFAAGLSNKKRKRTDCTISDKCPVSRKIRDLQYYLTRATCSDHEVDEVEEFCRREDCPGRVVTTETETVYQHNFAVSGYLESVSGTGPIQREVNWYKVIFNRSSESDDSKTLPAYAAHVLDDYNYGATISRGSSNWWTEHDCATPNSHAPTLTGYQYNNDDYTDASKALYDRGHLVPDADMSALGYKAVRSTYLFVNTAPQFNSLNRGLWSTTAEAGIRTRVRESGAIIVTGTSPQLQPLNDPKVPKFTALIPKYFWKLVCFKERGKNGGADTTIAIGYLQKNWKELIKEEKDTALVRRTQLDVIKTIYRITNTQVAQRKLQEIWTTAITNDLTRNRKPGKTFPTAQECLNGLDDDKPAASALDTKCDWQIKYDWLTSLMAPVDCKDMREEFARVATYYSRVSNASGSEDESNEQDPPVSYFFDWHYKTLADDGYFNSTVCNRRLVGYFNGSNPNYAFTHVTGLALTHSIYLTLPLEEDGSLNLQQLQSDSGSEAFAEFLLKVKIFDHIVSMVSIGENKEDSSRKFSSVASDPVKRIRFIDSVVKLLRVYDLRGVDINWQHFYLEGMENNDKENYITLLRELRQVFNAIEEKDETNQNLTISIVGPSVATEIDSGLDLPQLLKYADWINVNLMVDDEKVLPLYPFNVSESNPGRTNTDWVLRYYTCKAKEHGPFKINMGVAFQESPTAEYLKTLQERANYAVEKNLGGFSVIGIDKFKSRNYTQLELIRETNLCKLEVNENKYKCYNSEVQRWLPIGKEAPQCGDNAPKVNGNPAVCNPYDPDFGCCGATGTCGSGSGFCNCSTCVDYYNFPERIV